ncbi:MAG TPA: hypothetical protein VG186_15755 [Solirubrobacteraceae bacterium]|jgi:hypothetical protein|nr:hypothetical protein [Solirubrobacteraceae bacterium]
MSESEAQQREAGAQPRRWLIVVRYGIPAAMIIGGVLLAVLGSGDQGIEGFAMAVGGGLAVLLLNTLYRIGVQGESERAQEDAARDYYAEHGRWPPDPGE